MKKNVVQRMERHIAHRAGDHRQRQQPGPARPERFELDAALVARAERRRARIADRQDRQLRVIARRAEQRAVAAVRDDELRRLPLPGFGEIRESQQRTDVFEVFADQSDLHNFTPYWAVAATA